MPFKDHILSGKRGRRADGLKTTKREKGKWLPISKIVYSPGKGRIPLLLKKRVSSGGSFKKKYSLLKEGFSHLKESMILWRREKDWKTTAARSAL